MARNALARPSDHSHSLSPRGRRLPTSTSTSTTTSTPLDAAHSHPYQPNASQPATQSQINGAQPMKPHINGALKPQINGSQPAMMPQSNSMTASRDSSAAICMRRLPRNTSPDSLRSMLLFAHDFVGADFIQPSIAEDAGYRTAIARFRSAAAAADARAKLDGKPNMAGETNMIVDVVDLSPGGGVLSRRPTANDSFGSLSPVHDAASIASAASTATTSTTSSTTHQPSFTSASHPQAINTQASHPQTTAAQAPHALPIHSGSRYQTAFQPTAREHVSPPNGRAVGPRSPVAAASNGSWSGPSPIAPPRNRPRLASTSEADDAATADEHLARLMSDSVLGSPSDSAAYRNGHPLQSPSATTMPSARFNHLSWNNPNGMSPSSPPAAFSGELQSPHPSSAVQSPTSPLAPTSPGSVGFGGLAGPHGNGSMSLHGLPRHAHANTFPPVNPADQNPPCNTLYVGNLPIDTSEDELKALFSKQRGYRRLCFRTKGNGPMCFVEFEDVTFATKTLQMLYGYPLSNSVKGGIRLSFSKNPLGVRTGQTSGAAGLPSPLSPVHGPGSLLPGHRLPAMSPPYGTANGSSNGPPPGIPTPPGLINAGVASSNFDSGMGSNGFDSINDSAYGADVESYGATPLSAPLHGGFPHPSPIGSPTGNNGLLPFRSPSIGHAGATAKWTAVGAGGRLDYLHGA